MEWIIKPGFFNRRQVGKVQPGLDLSQAIGDFLIKHGILCREKCCGYKFNGTFDAYTSHELSSNDVETFTVPNTCTRMNVIGTAQNTNEELAITLPECVDGARVTIFIPFGTTVTFTNVSNLQGESGPLELSSLPGATYDFMCVAGSWNLLSTYNSGPII